MADQLEILRLCKQLGIDPERVTVMLEMNRGKAIQAFEDLIHVRLRTTGQPEPLVASTCVNCQGTKDKPLNNCRFRWHGGDVFGWGVVVEHGKSKPTYPKYFIDKNGHKWLTEVIFSRVKNRSGSKLVQMCKDLDVDIRYVVQRPQPARDQMIRDLIRRKASQSTPPKPTPPKVDLLPCQECGEMPSERHPHAIWSYVVECRPCAQVKTGGCYGDKAYVWCATESQAREEWNRKFGRALLRGMCEQCGESHQVCEDMGRCEPKNNPLNLDPCKCGEIPRPVAFKEGKGVWKWAITCCGRRSHGLYRPNGLATSKIKEWLFITKSMFITESLKVRYDIPTDVVLGCEELPEKYR